MIKITKEQIIKLQEQMAERTGGSVGVLHESLLDSAVAAPFLTFGGLELYSTIEEKAARLCHSLIANHAFADGNKRIGIHSMLIFLELNNIKLDYTDNDLVWLGMYTASSHMNYTDILNWIHIHKVK